MLNFECADKTNTGLVELCFTDSEGDESIKVCVSVQTVWDIAKEIRRKFGYTTTKRAKT